MIIELSAPPKSKGTTKSGLDVPPTLFSISVYLFLFVLSQPSDSQFENKFFQRAQEHYDFFEQTDLNSLDMGFPDNDAILQGTLQNLHFNSFTLRPTHLQYSKYIKN